MWGRLPGLIGHDRLAPALLPILVSSLVLQLMLIVNLDFRITGADGQTYWDNALAAHSLSDFLDQEAFSSNYWPAGYSLFLAPFRLLDGTGLLLVRITQAFMLIAIAWWLSRLVNRYYSHGAGITVGAVIAFSPTLVNGVMSIGYELVLAFCLTWAVILLRMVPTPPPNGPYLGAWHVAAAGLLLGFGLIIQFKIVLLLPIFAFLMTDRRLRRILLLGISTAVLPALWSIRNVVAGVGWQPWSSNGPINLWIGNNPVATGGYLEPPPVPDEWGPGYIDGVLQFVASQSNTFYRLSWEKWDRLFYPVDINDSLPTSSVMVQFVGTTILWTGSVALLVGLLLYLTGIVWQSGLKLLLFRNLAFVALGYIAVSIPFIVEPRFRIPIEPWLITLAVVAYYEVGRQAVASMRARQREKQQKQLKRSPKRPMGGQDHSTTTPA